MATNNETKTVLLDVQINNEIDKSIQKIVNIKNKIKELSEQQQEYTQQLNNCAISEQEYNKNMAVTENSIKALKKILLDQNNTLVEQYKQTDLVNGSMNQLSGKLSALMVRILSYWVPIAVRLICNKIREDVFTL